MQTLTKNQGIELIIANNPESYKDLRQFTELWIKNHTGEFTFEDIKTDYLKFYPEVPDNLNGAVMSKIAKKGLIICIGFEPAKLKAAKQRILRRWMAKGQIPMFS